MTASHDVARVCPCCAAPVPTEMPKRCPICGYRVQEALLPVPPADAHSAYRSPPPAPRSPTKTDAYLQFSWRFPAHRRGFWGIVSLSLLSLAAMVVVLATRHQWGNGPYGIPDFVQIGLALGLLVGAIAAAVDAVLRRIDAACVALVPGRVRSGMRWKQKKKPGDRGPEWVETAASPGQRFIVGRADASAPADSPSYVYLEGAGPQQREHAIIGPVPDRRIAECIAAFLTRAKADLEQASGLPATVAPTLPPLRISEEAPQTRIAPVSAESAGDGATEALPPDRDSVRASSTAGPSR